MISSMAAAVAWVLQEAGVGNVSCFVLAWVASPTVGMVQHGGG